jgi:hypothetical protein
MTRRRTYWERQVNAPDAEIDGEAGDGGGNGLDSYVPHGLRGDDFALHTGAQGKYLPPNETHPRDARPLFQRFQAAGAQLYLAVGTDRGLMGAIMARARAVLHMDVDAAVCRFNRINAALLRKAPNRDAYVRMRNDPSSWNKSLQNPRELEVLGHLYNINFWQSKVVGKSWNGFYEAPRSARSKFVGGVNYCIDDGAFQYLKALADAERIAVANGSLANQAQVEGVVSMLRRAQMQISVLDISNAWWRKYTGNPEALGHCLDALKQVAANNAIVVATQGTTRVRLGLSFRQNWFYCGFDLHAHDGTTLVRRMRRRMRRIFSGPRTGDV